MRNNEKLKLTEWVETVMPLFISGLLKKATGDVKNGEVNMFFYEWEIRIDFTPDRSLGEKIQNNY